MPTVEDTFSKALYKWRARLSEKEQKDYESTSLHDLKVSIIQIQTRLETTKENQNMKRVRKFLEAMEQFGKVVEVFANSSIYVAFIWGPAKFILQVSQLSSTVLYSLSTYISVSMYCVINSHRLQVISEKCSTFCSMLIKILVITFPS
jgi:hypothetical protein